MKVVTFYSFRGGVGRSLAVANVAYAMVESGERRVLVVDFDLEAPGLSFMDFLQPEKPAPKGGVFEFAKSYQRGQSPNLADYISLVKDRAKNLYFMRAGDLAGGYDVSELDINRLLSPKRRKVNFVDYFRAQAESLRFHYVLVDSRTGLTELGGMCTVGLPDLVVVLTGLNQQNLEGTRWVLQNIRTHGRDPKEALVVFSHLPDSEEELRNERMRGALRFLEVRQNPIFLPYHPRMSLVEELFVRSWPDRPLAAAYRDLARAVRERNDEDIENLLPQIASSAVSWWEPRERLPSKHPLPEAEVQRAEELVARAMALYPDSPRLAQEAGKLYATARKYAEAVPLLERYAYAAREFDPQSHVLPDAADRPARGGPNAQAGLGRLRVPRGALERRPSKGGALRQRRQPYAYAPLLRARGKPPEASAPMGQEGCSPRAATWQIQLGLRPGTFGQTEGGSRCPQRTARGAPEASETGHGQRLGKVLERPRVRGNSRARSRGEAPGFSGRVRPFFACAGKARRLRASCYASPLGDIRGG
jgi:MinD-like ATPase involved in chromosome partitioning or flagellar assembly